MNRNMTERKAFWHALMTVGLAVLLMTSVLIFLAELYSRTWPALSEMWPVMAVIFLVTGLILLPFVYRRYLAGPPPPLTPRQHRVQAMWQAAYVIAYLAICMLLGEKRISKWEWMIAGLLLSSALNHLRLANTKEGDTSLAQ